MHANGGSFGVTQASVTLVSANCDGLPAIAEIRPNASNGTIEMPGNDESGAIAPCRSAFKAVLASVAAAAVPGIA